MNPIRFFKLSLILILFATAAQESVAQRSGVDRISIPVYLQAVGRPYNGGLGEALGLRLDNHELGIQLPAPYDLERRYYLGAYYRYYLPGAGKPASPFFQLDGGFSDGLPPVISNSSGDPRVRSQGVSLGLGVDIKIKKGFGAYLLMSGSWTWLQPYALFPRGFSTSFYSPVFSGGLKYDILLKGERNEAPTLRSGEVAGARLSFSYRLDAMLTRWSDDRFGNFLQASHQITAEYGISPWLRAYGGLQFASTADGRGGRSFGLMGMGLGLKAHIYQYKRLSLLTEAGFWYLPWVVLGSEGTHFQLGGSLEYQVHPGLSVFAGGTGNWLAKDPVFSWQQANIGFTVQPGAWRK